MKPITLTFREEGFPLISGKLWQWDYGQILKIKGLELPEEVEIHFSLNPTGGESLTRIGKTKDGVTEVSIPGSMLAYMSVANYSVYVFVYLADEKTGQTVKCVKLSVQARPKPTDYAHTEEEHKTWKKLEKEIAALNDRFENLDITVPDEQISEAIEEYFNENPIEGEDVTEENIKEALGYTPADQEDVTELNEKLADI